jgi:hypothetical protein
MVGGFVNLSFFLGSVPPIWLVEKAGRRKVLLWGSVCTTIAMSGFTGCVANLDKGKAIQSLALFFIFFFNFAFGGTWVPLAWIYPPEITPLRLRHVGTAIAVGAEWLFAFVVGMILYLMGLMVVKSGPTALQNIGWKIYCVYAIFNFLQIPFVYFMCPETQGKSLEGEFHRFYC